MSEISSNLIIYDLNNDMENINKCLDFVFDNISTRKLCYGSNFPVSHKNSYSHWAKLLSEYINDNEAAKDLFYNTAKSIYFKEA